MNVDRTTWGPGPWDSEPDWDGWIEDGYPCVIIRHPRYGHLCGYVGVPSGHPWYDQDVVRADVHGGVTFTGAEFFDAPANLHLPRDVWWVGFDCHHGFDLAPGMESFLGGLNYGPQWAGQSYRDMAYVRDQCLALVAQARKVSLGIGDDE